MRPSTLGLLHLLCILRRLYTPPAKRIIPFCLSNKLRPWKGSHPHTHEERGSVWCIYILCAANRKKQMGGCGWTLWIETAGVLFLGMRHRALPSNNVCRLRENCEPSARKWEARSTFAPGSDKSAGRLHSAIAHLGLRRQRLWIGV